MLSLPTRRTFETLGMMMIGDGVLAVLQPRRHMALWRSGPAGWSRAVARLERRPGLAVALGVAEIGLGLWIAHAAERGRGAPKPLPVAAE